MFRLFIISFSVFLILSSCKQDSKVVLIEAHETISSDSIELFKYKIIRYLGKLPGKADHTTKFDTMFNNHYESLARQHDLIYYIPNKNNKNTINFLITRIAPSLYKKKVAIGGEVRFDDSGEVVFYKEEFRTWKMLIPELKEKYDLLFTMYLQGNDLTPYYTENSNGEEYIEFPNEHVSFDTEQRRWVSDLDDPLEPYYQLKR